MRAIVLAAGTGSRLGAITNSMTKGMVQVGGKRLIDYLLEFIDVKSFQEILIVGGFYFNDLKRYIDNKHLDNVKVIENTAYFKGNIFTLKRALQEFSGDSFLITNADHIYPPAMFTQMRNSFDFITAMCDFDRDLSDDDMKVKLSDDGRITKISKNLQEYDCGYIGMSYIDISMEIQYRKALEKAIARYGDKAVVENILGILAEKDEMAPMICDLSGSVWYEVDTESDLINVERRIFKDDNF